MISERMLRKWRKEALGGTESTTHFAPARKGQLDTLEDLNNRILRMTQELLDQHLLNKR